MDGFENPRPSAARFTSKQAGDAIREDKFPSWDMVPCNVIQPSEDRTSCNLDDLQGGRRTILCLETAEGPWTDVEQRSYRGNGHPHSQPITLKFEDLVYKVPLKKPQKSWRKPGVHVFYNLKQKPEEAVILKGITGIVKPGEMLAILGPSGSGKTTLLSIVGGHVGRGKLSGKVCYNDQPYSKRVNRRTGFVTQDDILHVNLTVKETLVYAALLRLPSAKYTKQDKVRRAEEMIVELGLEKCQDTRVGDAFRRGISGGERKRVSIGNELIVDPSLLLLDEPTTGLDSTTASRIITTLQKLANWGKTVITAINQPSSRVYHMFDKILLLSGGRALYYGHASEAISYFASLGFPPVLATNPADYLLDLANGVTHGTHIGLEEEGVSLEGAEEARDRQVRAEATVVECLSNSYERMLGVKEKQKVLSYKSTDLEKKAFNEKAEWPTSWLEQFYILLVRDLKERRHEAFGTLRVVEVVAASLICGLLWFDTAIGKIQDQVGLLFFFSTFWSIFVLFNAIFTFPQQRKLLIKERTAGMYRLSAYVLARSVGDLPLELVLPIGFITVVYWMSGLRPAVDAFILTMLVLLYNVLVAQGFGLFLGAAVMDAQQAVALATVIMLTLMLVGGYFVQTTPAFIRWVKYISFSYYSFKLLLSLQYKKGETYPCATGACKVDEYPAISQVGLGDEGICILALTCMLVGYRVLCYLALAKQKGFQ